MRKFLRMLLAVLFCTSAMCTTDVFANTITSDGAQKSNTETIQNSIQEVKSTSVNSNKGAYSDEEVYLLAQLVHHEAHNQSYNGKVAIAEVVLNRVRSGLFPNDVEDVINQKGQFLNSRRLKNINPTDLEVRIASNVLNGNLRVFNDTGVLYFRNPTVTSGISAKLDKNWGSLDYVTYIGDHAFYSQNIYNMQLAEEINREKDKESNEGSKSLLAKLPTSSIASAMASGKKATVKKAEAVTEEQDKDVVKADTEVFTDGNATIDEPLATEQAMLDGDVSADLVISVDGTPLTEEAEAMVMAQRAMLMPQSLSLADNEETSEETVLVDAAVMGASVAPVNVTLEKNDLIDNNDILDNNDTTSESASETASESISELSKDEEEEEEIDENDPIAVAQRKARRDQRVSIAQQAKLEQENAMANAAATEFAKQNVQAAVERANVLLKHGQVLPTVEKVAPQAPAVQSVAIPVLPVE